MRSYRIFTKGFEKWIPVGTVRALSKRSAIALMQSIKPYSQMRAVEWNKKLPEFIKRNRV